MDIIKKNNCYYNRRSRKKIRDIPLLNRIRSLRIPPAYTQVILSSNPDNKVQAIGIDNKDRKQYIYNKEHIDSQKKIKFEDLVYFGKKIKRIRKDMNRNINNCIENNKNIMDLDSIISVILYLVDRCNFRVGCDKYRNLYNTYGVTTLNKDHLKFNKNNIGISFVGKKGVLNKDNISNDKICSLLYRLSEINNGEYLFNYRDNKNNEYHVTEKHINKYLKKYNKMLSVKMFRTWGANYMLLRELLKYDIPYSYSQAKKNVNYAVKKAALNMHHTPTVSKSSYMNNEIIDLYLDQQNNKFYSMLEFFRKTNGKLPNIDRLLNLILQEINI